MEGREENFTMTLKREFGTVAACVLGIDLVRFFGGSLLQKDETDAIVVVFEVWRGDFNMRFGVRGLN